MYDPKIPLKSLDHPPTVLPLSDEDVFPSGETYLDRLFLTVHLWEQTRFEMRQNPENKHEILKLYEQRIRKLLQQAKSD
ncbi:MAG: hypothetical protein ACFFB3_14785 [Candidatus Hodarchaeota archaeon]